MINYWEDHCPWCGAKCVSACRCPQNDRKCESGHWWRRDPLTGRPWMLTEGHGEIVDWEDYHEQVVLKNE